MMTKLVYFFVITMTVVRCSACPIMCTCHNFSERSDYLTFYSKSDCGHRDVTAKHQNTQHCLEVSYLNETAVKDFVECFFRSETNAACPTHLRLINSVIPDNITFAEANCTEQLDLPGNNITNLSQINISLPNLTKLDLSMNSIDEINEIPFRDLRYLQTLNLSSNLISVIDSNSFSEMPDLLTLDLSNNHLSSLNDSIFHNSLRLQIFNLSKNYLKILHEQLFENLLELQQLDVSFNKLVVVSSAIHLPSLRVLKLNDNNKLGSSEDSYLFFLTGGCIQEVNASHIGLKQIPTSLTLTVRVLLLRGNSINALRRGDFDSYPLLQNLDVSSNNLSTIEYDALGRLNYLENLCLNNNSLKEVPKSLPENLKLLNMKNNMIQTINSKDFEGLHSLEVLLLSGNNITSIASDVGDNLKGLKMLDFSRNNILTVENGCFEGARRLENLKLSHAEIKTTCQISSIFYVDNIVSLDLSGSPGLAENFLADNTSHSKFKELQEVDVRDSKLSKIPANIFNTFRKLRNLRIGGNKLSCENLRLLSSWLKEHRPRDKISIPRCISPPTLTGIPIMDYAATLRYFRQLNEAKEERIRAQNKRKALKRTVKPKPKSRPKLVSSTTPLSTSQKVTRETVSATTEFNTSYTLPPMLNLSSKSLYEVSEMNYHEVSSTKASTMVANPLPYVNNKKDSNFLSATAVLFEIFSISIILLALIIIVKCSKRKKYNVEANQQENELLNSSVIELW